jgi:hypothetical protein
MIRFLSEIILRWRRPHSRKKHWSVARAHGSRDKYESSKIKPGAHGVDGLSRSLSMREVSGSIPDVSIFLDLLQSSSSAPRGLVNIMSMTPSS